MLIVFSGKVKAWRVITTVLFGKDLSMLESNLYCIHTKKLSCLKSGVEFVMNDNLYEFKYLHHF